MVHPHGGMSLSLPKEGHSDTGCDVDDSEDLMLVK